ncbi:methylornithine synthase PylB [Acetohalobium arabaticum]|uniref:Biotin synthase n=1 Tax=Acetohalobium arabaticum (strain ATCC 49924 / DSM 5501 / Z-7288) TaxID=574087 RepID=D9QUB1_ACEAZ|nr:methylornithine synthase PylB [Acetohalobium arabaticum]ADL11904.1 biotin synthase [Acetohalobium arabaticum DSM 5501]
MKENNLDLQVILDKAKSGRELKFEEIYKILTLKDKESLEQVFKAAREIRRNYFGNKIFLYGFVYFSTYCRNECTFCYYRKSNNKSPRYRKTPDEILQIAESLMNSGVHLIDLTMGEDPAIYTENNFGSLKEIASQIKDQTNLPVMVSPGVLPEDEVLELEDCGADWYACYQETHNRDLFTELRVNQSYDRRMETKMLAKNNGLLIEDGILLGVGEEIEDRVNSILTMKELGVHQGRVMSFVAQEGTPMADSNTPPRREELLVIAALRLVLQDRLIPASLDVDGIEGLEDRLNAGANVVTSLIPPSSGLAGVSNSTLDIDEGHRTVNGVQKVIEELDLKIAAPELYKEWVETKKMNLNHLDRDVIVCRG